MDPAFPAHAFSTRWRARFIKKMTWSRHLVDPAFRLNAFSTRRRARFLFEKLIFID